MKLIDLTGNRFGRLVVQARANNAGHHLRWHCLCDCGKSKTVNSSHLKTGHTTSCGCAAAETIAKRNKENATHGMWKTAEFGIWVEMKKRCHNPKHRRYADYGGRGIVVCDEWRASFQAFFDYIGPRPSADHSIDRMRNGEGYKPGNVRWATDTEQNNNKRTNVTALIGGEVMTAAQIAAKFGLGCRAVCYRIAAGKSEAEIVAKSRRTK